MCQKAVRESKTISMGDSNGHISDNDRVKQAQKRGRHSKSRMYSSPTQQIKSETYKGCRSPDQNQTRPNLRTKPQAPIVQGSCGTAGSGSLGMMKTSSPVPIPARTPNGTAARGANTAPAIVDGDLRFAGAKFNEPPSPELLPKPPTHWVQDFGPDFSPSSWDAHDALVVEPMLYDRIACQLKTLLKVQN